MQEPRTRGEDVPVNAPITDDRIIETPRTATIGPERQFAYAPYPETRVGENVMEVRDLVRWGPIAAGLATTIGSLVVLSVLGIALGASVLDRNAPGAEIGTWAAIWGAASAIISFFLGGVVAAKTASVPGPGTGMLNGLMVGFAAIVLMIWLTGMGLGGLFGTVGANLDDITTAVLGTAGVEEAVDQAQAQAAQADLRATFDDVRDASWGTFVGLILALGAAALGGFVAHNKRRDLIEGTG